MQNKELQHLRVVSLLLFCCCAFEWLILTDKIVNSNRRKALLLEQKKPALRVTFSILQGIFTRRMRNIQ